MKHSAVTVSSRAVDYVGTVDGFTLLPDLGLFAKKTHVGVELTTIDGSSSLHIAITS